MQTIAALVPMRHVSERVQGKNYRPLAGKPLYEYILAALLSCPEIHEIVVDTDSPVIMSGVEKNFPQVHLLERPAHLRAGEIPMNEVLLHDVSMIEADYYLQTHSTNPLLKSITISRAIKTFLENYPANDSLFSVTRWHTRLWDESGAAINHDPQVLLRTQDLPPIFEENSCLYIFSRRTLEERRNRIGEHPYLFEIDAEEAWDIDDEIDFKIADLLLSDRMKVNSGT
jgi:CMP-N-acetylneuraminic acid synthetase